MSSIVIAGVSWHTPTATALFTDLNLTFGPERTGLIGRNGSGKTTLLRLISGELSPLSGTVTKPASVGFLRQNPEQVTGATLADLFGVKEQLEVLARAERGEATADDLADADWTLEARLMSALEGAGLGQAPNLPLSTLSGGQRTRAGLAALMFGSPDALLLDEPTNHLDRAGRAYIIERLRSWSGCVVVASHDRALLDHMDAIVELTTLGARTYGGNYASYRAAKDAELASAQQDLDRAERGVAEARSRAQLAAERKARTDRQGRRLRASGGQSKLLLDAAKERSEGSGASAARIRSRQIQEAEAVLEAAQEAVEVLQPLVMDVPPSKLVPGRQVLRVDRLGFGYLPDAPVFQDVSFEIRGPERVALSGANGSGKSTLLGCIHGDLSPQSGSLALKVPAALLDQDVGLLESDETVREAFARIDPHAGENHRRAVLARFLFRGGDADQRVGSLSGGERLRAGLACILGHSEPRQLLLLDEPSNHLDLEAVETLEAALVSYDGAILVVSHDTEFLRRIGVEREIGL